jgi:3'-phosphoadenosine 5'-phosphosulfate sulfotransferase (PAPS reductase)/FAD synthetase
MQLELLTPSTPPAIVMNPQPARLEEVPEITVLSFGGGQDSTALLVLFLFDAIFRAKYAPGLLVVVFSDTGNEHPQTYTHLERMKALCAGRGDVVFLHLTPGDPYHLNSWPSLNEHHDRLATIGSQAYPKTCTDNLKVAPVYKALDDFIGSRMFDGYDFTTSKKRALHAYGQLFGRLRVVLGIAKGEEKRVATGETGKLWFDTNVLRVYPLIEEGLDRAACQRVIAGFGVEVPMPSNCMRCPFLSKVELLWLWRQHPEEVLSWAAQERAKLRRCEAEGVESSRNYGVFKHRTIMQTVFDAIAQHGHMTDDELTEFKMSHGHCVQSKF